MPQFELHFEPAFVFPGERFLASAAANAKVASDSLTFTSHDGRWAAVAPDKPVEIWATLGEEGNYEAAAKKWLPVASGAAIFRARGLQLVPLHGDAYGAVLANKRFAEFLSFELAPRSAPMRNRIFEIEYRYFGPDSATLIGNAGGLLKVSVVIENNEIALDYLTLFDLSGTVRILGKEFAIPQSPPADKGRFVFPIPKPLGDHMAATPVPAPESVLSISFIQPLN